MNIQNLPQSEMGQFFDPGSSHTSSFVVTFLLFQVCREFSRGACSRSEDVCRFAHPESQVSIEDVGEVGPGGTVSFGRVTVCMDFVKSGGISCSASTNEKCKYYHPPPHIMVSSA